MQVCQNYQCLHERQHNIFLTLSMVHTMGFEKFGTKSSIIFSGILIPIVVLGWR